MSFDILLPSHISFKYFVNDEKKIFMSSFKIHHIYLVACSSCLVPRRHSRCESGGRAGEKGRGKEARRLADNVFKMVECLMAADYVIFQKRVRGFHQVSKREKHLKPLGRRPSGFIVFERLET